jgi:hypothetical protein
MPRTLSFSDRFGFDLTDDADSVDDDHDSAYNPADNESDDDDDNLDDYGADSDGDETDDDNADDPDEPDARILSSGGSAPSKIGRSSDAAYVICGEPKNLSSRWKLMGVARYNGGMIHHSQSTRT